MKHISFETDAILPKLAMVNSVVAQKTSLPILSSVLIEVINVVDDNMNSAWCMSLTTSDGDMYLKAKVPIKEASEEFKFCVNANDLIKTLKNLSGTVLTIEFNEERKLLVANHITGEFTLPYTEGGEYPSYPYQRKGDEKCIAMQSNNLLNAFNKCCFASANDELRPIMNGVHLDFINEGMIAVASDGHKLVKYTDHQVKPIGEDVYITLHKKSCGTLINVLSSLDNCTINLLVGNTNYFYVFDENHSFEYATRLIDGNYPKYDAVIPKDNDKSAIIDKAAIIASLKRVLPLGSQSTELVKMEFGNNKLVITAEDIDFSKSAKENIICEYTGEPITIGFKGSILMQLIQNIEDEKVTFLLKDSTRAGIVNPATQAEEYAYTSILMPMLINI